MLSLHTEICDMLGIEYPIFAFNHCQDVTAAVSNAGGIGVLGVSGVSFDEKRVKVEWLRKNTDKPFGLDLLLPQANPDMGTHEELMSKIPRENIEFMNNLRKELGIPDGYIAPPPLDGLSLGIGGTLASQEEEVDAICDLKPAILACALGANATIVEKCHKAGIKVASLAGTVRHALRQAKIGVDIIVAVGTDAGGHTGKIGTMSLVPQVVDAVKPIPVLAAGGIADGRGIVAALALGAAGVWTGTIWLTAHENPVEEYIKDRVIHATEEDAVITRAFTGKTGRGLKNKFIEYWEQPGAPKPLPAPFQSMYLPLPISVFTDEDDRTWERLGLHDWISTPAGQGVGLVKQRKSARNILHDMVAQAIEVLG